MLSETYWGASPNLLKQVYLGSAKSVMEYASSSWATSAKTNQDKLDRIQNMGLRMTLGALGDGKHCRPRTA